MHRTATLPVLLLVASVACGGSSSGDAAQEGDETVSARLLSAAATAVCQAAEQADSDPTAAKDTFFGRAHDDLHTIARVLDDTDRKAAAELLRAKQAVEAAFSGGAPSAELRAGLLRLAAATSAGLERLDVPTPRCQ
jgi:hypothetical protein